MNDDPPSPSPAAATAGFAGADAAHDRPQESWLSRLKSAVGFRAPSSLREDLESALSGEGEDGEEAFTAEERTLLKNILHLRELRVEDVMIPRAAIIAVEGATPLASLIRTFLASGHSRLPIYRETLDDPIGMVHIKDLMFHIAAAAEKAGADAGPAAAAETHLPLAAVDLSCPTSEAGVVRPVLFVPPSMPATDLLAKMKAERMQIALVIDEYGGTDGLVSLEDLVETVVGDIEDEHDEEDAMISSPSEGVWVADARVELDELSETIGPDFQPGAIDEEVDTLGGLVFTLVGRIPVRGELIAASALPGFEFEVLDADPRRLKRIKIFRRPVTEPPGPRAEPIRSRADA